MLAANPDVVIGETTGKFCPTLMAGLAAGGYKGITIISATCASVASFFKPVDPAGNGVYILGQQKDPSDPRYADDPAMEQYKDDVAKYGAGVDANNGQSHRVQHRRSDRRRAQKGRRAGWRPDPCQHHERGVDHGFDAPADPRRHGEVDGIKDAYVVEYAEMLQYDAPKHSQVPTGDLSTSRARRACSRADATDASGR